MSDLDRIMVRQHEERLAAIERLAHLWLSTPWPEQTWLNTLSPSEAAHAVQENCAKRLLGLLESLDPKRDYRDDHMAARV